MTQNTNSDTIDVLDRQSCHDERAKVFKRDVDGQMLDGPTPTDARCLTDVLLIGINVIKLETW